MSKLPVQKKILREDIKEAPQWVERLILPINSFFETVYNALTKNITLHENISAQIKELEFNTLSTYNGSVDEWEELKFPKTIKHRANAVLLAQIIDQGPIGENLTSYRPIEFSVYVDWQESNEEIIIGLIYGLEESRSYKVRLIVI